MSLDCMGETETSRTTHQFPATEVAKVGGVMRDE